MDAYEEARRAQYAKIEAVPLECAIFERFDIEMTMEQARDCSHPGDCSQDVEELIDNPDIVKQIERIGANAIREELAEYGAWDDEELTSDAENVLRILWIAASNIVEENIQNT